MLNDNDISRVIANPFYAINIDPSLCLEHETLISEEIWISAAINSINELWVEAFLKDLLENLKWNFI